MFAAVFVTPSMTTDGIPTPTGTVTPALFDPPRPASSAVRRTVRMMAGTTAAGADGWGVAIRSRVLASVPVATSTAATLIPLPPTSTPIARPDRSASVIDRSSEVVDRDPAVDHEVRAVRPAALVRREVHGDVDDLLGLAEPT